MAALPFALLALSAAGPSLVGAYGVHGTGRGHQWAERMDHARRQSCPDVEPPSGFSDLQKYFPEVGQIASIVEGDTVATNLYNQILNTPEYATALAFPPAGTNEGDFTGVPYNASDPKCWWTYSTCHTPKQPYLAEDTWYCPEPRTWGLTFDDGPYCTHDEFYDFLSQHGLKASVFYIGTNIMQNPTQAQRGITDGHEVCVHTWEHKYMTSLTNTQVFSELYYTKKLIKDLLGVTTTCWRPPFGDVDDRVRTWAYALGLRTVIWNHDTFDWSEGYDGVTAQTVENNYHDIIEGVSDSSGVIVLTHELNPNTMGMFMSEYPSVAAAFDHLVPVASCMNITHPYLETSISYPTFAEFIDGDINATHVDPVVSDLPISVNTADPFTTASGTAFATSTSSAHSAGNTTSSGATTGPGATEHTSSAPARGAMMHVFALALAGLVSAAAWAA